MTAKYRDNLPQLSDKVFLSDGGLETVMIFHENIDLPEFSAVTLMTTEIGKQAVRDYYTPYIKTAVAGGRGYILDSATWRAGPGWAEKVGMTEAQMRHANLAALDMLTDLRTEFETENTPIVISGVIGPRGDGYVAGECMSIEDAIAYHNWQAEIIADSSADMISAITMTYPNEAIGIVLAAKGVNMPVVISFTVETDGRLPHGETLAEAIQMVDAATDGYPAYYMVNCAHTTHFDFVLEQGTDWMKRIQGMRANASKLSHAELDEAEELDDGNPQEFGKEYAQILKDHGHMNVFGGCCGTDHRHIVETHKAVG